MKLKTFLLTTTLLASSVAFADAPASAKTSKDSTLKDFYAKAEAGVTMPSQLNRSRTENNTTRTSKAKFDKGLVGGIGAGYTVNEFFRTDLMLQSRQANITKKTGGGRLSNTSAMLNGYLTGHNDTIFTPYVMVGAGLGQTNVKIKDANASFKKTGLIWNAGVGCQAKVTDQVSVDLGYRYVSLGTLGKKTVGTGADATTYKFKKLASNEVVAGLVFNF
jgi:opacity protein-like surface antigen